MNNIIHFAIAVSLVSLVMPGCSRSASQPMASVKPGTGLSDIYEATAGSAAPFAVANPVAIAEVSISSAGEGLCDGALDALASCAATKTCGGNISTYLPAASRSALIALEGMPGYSEDAFDRYCLDSCRSRDSKVDLVVFAREVCGVDGEGVAVVPFPDAGMLVRVTAFSLQGMLEVGVRGVPLAQVVQAFGQPRTRRITPYECDSAFDEGTIQEYIYPEFSLETDGKSAVVRFMKVGGGNTVLLSDGQSFGVASEFDLKQVFGGDASNYGAFYRTSASPDGSLETAYDLTFKGGKLDSVAYWIGC